MFVVVVFAPGFVDSQDLYCLIYSRLGHSPMSSVTVNNFTRFIHFCIFGPVCIPFSLKRTQDQWSFLRFLSKVQQKTSIENIILALMGFLVLSNYVTTTPWLRVSTFQALCGSVEADNICHFFYITDRVLMETSFFTFKDDLIQHYKIMKPVISTRLAHNACCKLMWFHVS